ncbi:MAG: transposase, partial [Myxococcota bacterium]
MKKLFAMLRLHRLELFDAAFQDELADMYRGTGAGRPEIPPAQMCMALLLQAYTGVSDAEAVEMTVMDARWRMVLDHLDSNEPLFGQGTLQRFRERLIEHALDQRLLERTVDIAKDSGVFDWKQIPGSIKVAMDSRPFEGAGRVEDTFNLLGHAARKLAEITARLLEIPFGQLCLEAGAPILAASSIKAYLDIDWSKPEQKDEAFAELFNQVEGLSDWLSQHIDLAQAPLTPYIEALIDVCEQNVDTIHGVAQIRQGTVANRRISIEEEQSRHGR